MNKTLNLKSPLGKLPDNWRVVQLKDIATKIGSGATPKGGQSVYLTQRHQFALIRSQNVFDRFFDRQGLAFISDEHAAQLQGVFVQSGDLLLNITGDGITFARATQVPLDIMPACVNQHVAIIRPNSQECCSGYLLAYLTHPLVKEYMESFNAGGSRRAITKGHIESFVVPLPPISEQRAIAHVLGSLDDKIELNRQMNETLEGIARALFKSWFVDFDPVRAKMEGREPYRMDAETAALFPDGFEDSTLGEIPKGWGIGVLDDVTEMVLGGDWGSSNLTEETPNIAFCIRGADIPDLQAANIAKMPFRYLKAPSISKRRVQPGDLVIEISGGSPTQSTGRPVLVTSAMLNRYSYPIVCSNFCRMLRLKLGISPEYVYLWLRWLYDSDALLQYENGTTGIKNFAYTVFSKNYGLVIPPPKLIKCFEQVVNALFEKREKNGAEQETLIALRDTLLPKLLCGEIRVNDAEKAVEAAV